MNGVKNLTQRQSRRAVFLIASGVLAVGAIVLILVISPWSETEAGQEEAASAEVQPIEGTELSRVVLSDEAAERLDVQTAPVEELDEASADGQITVHKVIPYAALRYDVDGETYVYTSPEPLTFVRAPVTVDQFKDDNVILSEGPDAGTAVVTVGAAELYGAEFEFEEE
jgi:hypothetical protein